MVKFSKYNCPHFDQDPVPPTTVSSRDKLGGSVLDLLLPSLFGMFGLLTVRLRPVPTIPVQSRDLMIPLLPKYPLRLAAQI